MATQSFLSVWTTALSVGFACTSFIILASSPQGQDGIILGRIHYPLAMTCLALASVCMACTAFEGRIRRIFSQSKPLPAHRQEAGLSVPLARRMLPDHRSRCICLLPREELERLYRRAAFGKMAAGIFHDILNPLTAILLEIERLVAENSDADYQALPRDSVENARSAARRIERYVKKIKRQVCADEKNDVFNATDELRDALDILGYQSRRNNVSLSLDAPDPIVIYGNPARFSQIVTNLVSNAIESYPDIGISSSKKSRGVRITFFAKKGQAFLLVADKGSGVSPVLEHQIWQPFFSTKTEGMGLGLATTKSIVESHFHGTVSMERGRRAGSRFSVTIPLPESNP